MENQLRPIFFENVVDAIGPPNVAETGCAGQRREAFRKLKVNCVKIELAIFDENELRRLAGGDLKSEFGADRAAGTCDENPAPPDEPQNGIPVQSGLRPFQQIGQLDRFEFKSVFPLGILQLRHLG